MLSSWQTSMVSNRDSVTILLFQVQYFKIKESRHKIETSILLFILWKYKNLMRVKRKISNEEGRSNDLWGVDRGNKIL